MKENAIQKINQFGKISAILARVVKILLCVAAGLLLVASIALMCMPKELLTMKLSGKAKIMIDISRFGTISAKDQEETMNVLQDGNGDVNMNGVVYGFVDGEVTDTTITINAQSEDTSIGIHSFAGLLLTALLAVAMTIVTICFMEALCKAFRDCSSPFEENVIKKMQNLAFSLIPWTVINSVTNSIVEGFFTGNVDVKIGVNMTYVIIVLIILALAYVFKYGAMLQKESDETL